jgi:hypothetical protein
VRAIQDIGMPCQGRNVVHQRQQMRSNAGLIKHKRKPGKHKRAAYIIFPSFSGAPAIFLRSIPLSGVFDLHQRTRTVHLYTIRVTNIASWK